MQKIIIFGKPQILTNHWNFTEYIYPFSVIDSSLIGSPEEKSKTDYHEIKVGMSRDLQSCWDLKKSDLVKVLFEFGKRHVIQKLKDGTLSEKEELSLHTGNTEKTCPFDISRIPNPNRATFKVQLGEEKIMQNQDQLQVASSIIDARDNINAIFRESHKEKLLLLTEERDILQLFRDAFSEEDFFYRLSALTHLVINLNISCLREITGIEETTIKSIGLFESYLKQFKILDERIISTFKSINKIRQSYPVHGDNVEGVLKAHKYFGFDYPIKDYNKVWRILLLNYLDALQRLLEALKNKP